MAKAAELGTSGHPLKMQINKRFFVSMLTRDIELEDAILDLLDNCLDGLIRSTEKSLNGRRPYSGYWAKISLANNRFEISDNCGGIPENLIERAFGIGRAFDPNEHHRTIGIYGIGMKRAIFKMALEATVESHSKFGFQVRIDESWLNNENNWKLEYRRVASKLRRGTRIVMSRLRPEIDAVLSTKSFQARLNTFIAKHYAVIIDKGFQVEIDGVQVAAASTEILSSALEAISSRDAVLAPYMFRYATEKVDVKLWVGMYRNPPETDGDEDAEAEQRQSSDNSGWTVICNDRAVVSNYKTIITGWGEAGVPRFHPQFIGIRGILTLDSNYPLELPLTTTKRGLDASSELYLRVKEYMREGTKAFTNFTNHWKSNRARAKKLFTEAQLTGLPELRKLMKDAPFTTVKKITGAQRFEPNLPGPVPSEMKRVSFVRHQDQIARVGLLLLKDARAKASDVGGACFDEVYRRVPGQ